MKIVYVNPAAVELFGATSEQDLVGTPVLRWHHPDYHQIVRERIRKATEEGNAAPMIESKYFKLDGTVMDLEVQGKPIIYNGLPAILATFNDVTERRNLEHQLGERFKEIHTLYYLSQLSEREDLSLTALYQELIDFLPKGWQYPEIACSRMVIDGVEFCSGNFEDSAWKLTAPLLANDAPKGWIGVAYLREAPREDKGPFLKEESVLINAIAQQLGKITEQRNAEEERTHNEEWITYPDGRKILLDTVKSPYWAGDGTLIGIIGISRDITERKKAEDELNWNRVLLLMMPESSPLGFLVVDNLTDDILYYNKRFLQIWGIEHLSGCMGRGELKNNDIIPYCLPVLVGVHGLAESCKPLQDESNRAVIEDELKRRPSGCI